MAMTSSPSRLSLKAELLQRIQCLDRADALLPSHHPDIDDLITELEALTPIQQPLLASHFSTLLGSWELIYASRGTVVTRRMEDLINLPIGIRRVWQRLTLPPKSEAPITAENGAVLSLPLVGELTAIAQGIWQPYAEAESAQVSFGAFSLQPTRVLGLAGWRLPKLTLPVLDFLRRDALWITSYLDDDLRFGRGVTGNLFVFRREGTNLRRSEV